MNEVANLAIRVQASQASTPRLQQLISNRLAYMRIDMEKLELMVKNSDLGELDSHLEAIEVNAEKLALLVGVLRERFSLKGQPAKVPFDPSTRPSTISEPMVEVENAEQYKLYHTDEELRSLIKDSYLNLNNT